MFTKIKIHLFIILSGLLVSFSPTITATALAHELAAEMKVAATKFFDALDEKKQSQISFEFDDENREGWHFIPKQRPGLPIGDLTTEQYDLAMTLLQTALSHRGLETSKQIMSLESVLHEMENGNPKRDPARYNFYFFGKPSDEQPWGWRIEGHHLSVNITIADGEVLSATPAFMGANPAEVRVGKRKGFRALAQQEDLGRKLIKQLTVEQKSVAIVSEKAPRDVINGPGKKAERLEPQGIAASEMTEQQRAMLTELIDSYLDNFRPELCEVDRKKIEDAGVEKIYFAWAGFIQPGKPHYYRVQGPTFIFEYDNVQNNANHVHAMWRDTENDFGTNLLKLHYEQVPHGTSP
ncbi:DUF3500 domain-containing protein [bacterium]|nr:DUF3500 domain-containing protein [bacterium]